MTTAWAHHPNAQHIDQVLVNLKAGLLKKAAQDVARDAAWDAAWSAAWSAARDAARDAAWDAAWSAAWSAAWDAAWDAAWSAVWSAARDAAWSAARDAARDAILALVAYDNCAHLLTMPLGGVRLMASIQHPAAILLFPYLQALEINKTTP